MNATPDQILQFVFLLAVFGGIAVAARRLFGGATIAAAEVMRRRAAGEELMVLDVRSPAEFADGHIDGAVNLPLPELEARLRAVAPQLSAHRDARLVLVCRSSARAHAAAKSLRRAGVNGALVMSGGMLAWTGRGFPVIGGSARN